MAIALTTFLLAAALGASGVANSSVMFRTAAAASLPTHCFSSILVKDVIWRNGTGWSVCTATDTWTTVPTSASAVPFARTIATTSPLGGGGDLSADRTLTCAACLVSGGALGTPLSGTATNITGLPLAGLVTQSANTVPANATSGVAALTAFAMPSCSSSANALIWTTSVGFGCNAGIAASTVAYPLAGSPTAPTAATDDNSTAIATTAYYNGQKGTATPLINGTATAGASAHFAPIDHVHPTDTSRLAAANVSGTTGNLAKFTSASAVGNSILVESSGKIGVGATPLTGLDGRFTFFVSGNGSTATMQTAFGYDAGNVFSVIQSVNIGVAFTPLVLQEFANVGVGANPVGTGRLQVLAGSSTTMASTGGTVAFSSASTGNTAGTETDIRTTTLAASILANNGDGVSFVASGSFAATASVNKRIIAYFGGTAVFDSGSLAITSASTWRLTSSCDRTSSTAVTCSTTLSSSATGALTAVSQETSVSGLTLTNTQIYKITGNATNANDVVAHLWKVRWDSAP